MESNFIKERIVIRENIIKSKLKQSNEKRHQKEGSASQDLTQTPPDRVVVFEELVNERFKQDLVDLSKQVEIICQTIADYLKLKSAIKILKKNSRDVKVQTNIGCNFYAQCHISDASKVYLCIGKDYFLHMELDHALEMIEFKEKQWTKQLDVLQERASRIKAYIKIALETMGHLYELDRDRLTEA